MDHGLPVKDPSLFFICRFCKEMALQVSKGESVCHRPCGGPRKGRAFPLYSGPLTSVIIETHCFVCGEKADKRLRVGGYRREIGICMKHIMFTGINPKDLPPPKTEHQGVIQRREVKRVSIYEALGIDPVNDLGFREADVPKEKPDDQVPEV